MCFRYYKNTWMAIINFAPLKILLEVPAMSNVRVRQIARDLSLSPGTVSKALRGSAGKVSFETTEMVLEHCHKNGYMSRVEADRILFKMRSQVSGKQLFTVTCRRGVLMYDAVFGAICEQMQDNNLYPSAFLINSLPVWEKHF